MFAFLSASSDLPTAELTDKSVEDEVRHLATPMQFCEFPIIIGTVWAMADTDGWDLAGNFTRRC